MPDSILPDKPDSSLEVGWHALVNDSGVSVLILDAQARILFVNEAAARKMGHSAEELRGRKYQDFLPPETIAERLAYIRRVAETGLPIVLEQTMHGCRRRTALRPFPSDAAGNTRVLLVCRPSMGENVKDSTTDAEYVQAKNNDLGSLGVLTPRELEILCLIGQGMATADIARHLHRSEKTVEWHRVSIGNKLGANNRVELARIAMRSGLVDLNECRNPPATADADPSARA
jgi:PAS domain S-box-containing protein